MRIGAAVWAAFDVLYGQQFLCLPRLEGVAFFCLGRVREVLYDVNMRAFGAFLSFENPALNRFWRHS